MKNKKVSLLDWRFKLGVVLLLLVVISLIVSLVLLASASFVDNFNQTLGSGFWSLKHYGVHELLFNWSKFDDDAIKNSYQTHPFLQVFVAIIILLFITPIFLILGVLLVFRWWFKTRI